MTSFWQAYKAEREGWRFGELECFLILPLFYSPTLLLLFEYTICKCVKEACQTGLSLELFLNLLRRFLSGRKGFGHKFCQCGLNSCSLIFMDEFFLGNSVRQRDRHSYFFGGFGLLCQANGNLEFFSQKSINLSLSF